MQRAQQQADTYTLGRALPCTGDNSAARALAEGAASKMHHHARVRLTHKLRHPSVELTRRGPSALGISSTQLKNMSLLLLVKVKNHKAETLN